MACSSYRDRAAVPQDCVMRSKLATGLVAVIAAFLVATNPVVADGARQITGKQIKDGSVTGKDVKDGSLVAPDFASGQLPAGAAGPQGVQGPPGVPGQNGAAGPAPEVRTLAGGTASSSPPVAGTFVMVEPTIDLDLTTATRLVAAASLPTAANPIAGQSHPFSTNVTISMCRRQSAAAAAQPFLSGEVLVHVSELKTAQAVAVSGTLTPGHWEIGPCFRPEEETVASVLVNGAQGWLELWPV
jgi:hypothetical protein